MLEAGVKADQEFSTGGNGDTQRSAFMFACHSGSVTTIRALLQAVFSNYAEHYKCRNRKAFCSSFFAKQYLIPQTSWIEESFSTTDGLEMVFLIHFAIARDNLEMTRQIVTSSDKELERNNLWEPFRHGGFTPLHIACLFNRSLAMIELLLSFGQAKGNLLLQKCSRGRFADQMTSDQTV
ncbi:unnamed protein product [Adineta steineri]|uniref:Uncharacterized protein n=1 Tax=Adineta steineri TaxID=433720 RepID=A0A814X8I8_9BILA|nr:unnamed protein product [Adineta steineri]